MKIVLEDFEDFKGFLEKNKRIFLEDLNVMNIKHPQIGLTEAF